MEVIAELPQNPVFVQGIFGFLAQFLGDARGQITGALWRPHCASLDCLLCLACVVLIGPGVHGAVSEPSQAGVGPKLYCVVFCVDLPGTPILSEVDLGAGRHFGCLVVASWGVFQRRGSRQKSDN